MQLALSLEVGFLVSTKHVKTVFQRQSSHVVHDCTMSACCAMRRRQTDRPSVIAAAFDLLWVQASNSWTISDIKVVLKATWHTLFLQVANNVSLTGLLAAVLYSCCNTLVRTWPLSTTISTTSVSRPSGGPGPSVTFLRRDLLWKYNILFRLGYCNMPRAHLQKPI